MNEELRVKCARVKNLTLSSRNKPDCSYDNYSDYCEICQDFRIILKALRIILKRSRKIILKTVQSRSKGLFGTALLHKSQLSFMNFTAEQLSFEVAEFLKVFG
jgi:hypothetical protein